MVMGSSREKRGCGGGTNHILPRGERDHNGRRNITRISGDMDTIPHICWWRHMLACKCGISY